MDGERRAQGKYRVQLPDLDYYRRTIQCQAGCPVSHRPPVQPLCLGLWTGV
jgi:hypothetical protein